MAATSVNGQPLYGSDDSDYLIGADIFVHFSISGVRSSPVQVEVLSPEIAPVHATFDLSRLR